MRFRYFSVVFVDNPVVTIRLLIYLRQVQVNQRLLSPLCPVSVDDIVTSLPLSLRPSDLISNSTVVGG